MNYSSIYDQLILDRRSNPPSAEEYVEVHHIVPRHVGGSDDPSNLIRLRPEDHFFAHLLLAHIYPTREMWATCVLMCGHRWHNSPPSSRMYGMVKRAMNAASLGEAAPNADLKEYVFYNLDGDEFKGTRIAFGEKFSVPSSSVNRLVRGTTPMAYGWVMEKMTRAEYAARKSARLSVVGKRLKGLVRDPRRFVVYHEDTSTSISAPQAGIRDLTGLTSTQMSNLINGKTAVCAGWCLLENAEWAHDYAAGRGVRPANDNVASLLKAA